jgi:hypothetical protein
VGTETSIAARQQNPSIKSIAFCKDLYIAAKWDFRSPRCWPHGGGMERRSESSWYGCTPFLIHPSIFVNWKLKFGLCLQVGLDAAGKTTILYKMKFGEVVQTTPTIGIPPPPNLPFLFFELYPLTIVIVRFQRRDGRVQELEVQRVGRWRSGQGTLSSIRLLKRIVGDDNLI